MTNNLIKNVNFIVSYVFYLCSIESLRLAADCVCVTGCTHNGTHLKYRTTLDKAHDNHRGFVQYKETIHRLCFTITLKCLIKVTTIAMRKKVSGALRVTRKKLSINIKAILGLSVVLKR